MEVSHWETKRRPAAPWRAPSHAGRAPADWGGGGMAPAPRAHAGGAPASPSKLPTAGEGADGGGGSSSNGSESLNGSNGSKSQDSMASWMALGVPPPS